MVLVWQPIQTLVPAHRLSAGYHGPVLWRLFVRDGHSEIQDGLDGLTIRASARRFTAANGTCPAIKDVYWALATAAAGGGSYP